jgi:hypothetical protein
MRFHLRTTPQIFDDSALPVPYRGVDYSSKGGPLEMIFLQNRMDGPQRWICFILQSPAASTS